MQALTVAKMSLNCVKNRYFGPVTTEITKEDVEIFATTRQITGQKSAYRTKCQANTGPMFTKFSVLIDICM